MPSRVPRGLIFTGDTFIEAGCVLVEQSKSVIVEVGRKSEPEGARILDVQGSTILPGLIDSHIHFFGSKKYDLMEWVTTRETLVALRSVADMRRLLNAGFTAVRDLGSKPSTYLKGEKELLAHNLIYRDGRSLGIFGGPAIGSETLLNSSLVRARISLN